MTHDHEPISPTELNRVLLTITYPAFRFTILTAGIHHSRWLAVRKRGTDPGVHTVVTDNLDELQEALGPPDTETRHHRELPRRPEGLPS